MKTRNILMTLALAASMGLVACSGDYKHTVEQGRCVKFADDTVTFVRDGNTDPRHAPVYENKVLTFKMPVDPKEKGPEPVPGSLISFNADKKEVAVFINDSMQTVPVEVVNVQKGVPSHNSAVKDKKFPMVNKDKNEVTLYLNRTLATLKIPGVLPADEAFWTAGDSVRVFFKEKGQALRYMNITKTNIFKK